MKVYTKKIQKNSKKSETSEINPSKTGEMNPSKINKLTEDIQRTGAKVVYSSPIQDSKKESDPYHIFKVLRTKPGRVSYYSLLTFIKFCLSNIIGFFY